MKEVFEQLGVGDESFTPQNAVDVISDAKNLRLEPSDFGHSSTNYNTLVKKHGSMHRDIAKVYDKYQSTVRFHLEFLT